MKRENHNMKVEQEPAEGQQPLGQMMQEINLLKLEGSVFCFDPKQAKHRTQKLTLQDAAQRPIVIEVNPLFGQPSHLAYRVLQIFLCKLSKQPYPFSGEVPFTWRGVAGDLNRSWGGKTQRELINVLGQLQTTRITCSLIDKKGNGEIIQFVIVPSVRSTVRHGSLEYGVLTLETQLVRSINARHIAYFNLARLSHLDVIGMVMYKRLFFHFSNIYNPQRGTKRSHLCYHKDYEAICREWLGGLKPQKHRSQIMRDQLGRHLDAVIRSGLIRKCDITKRADGSGFKLTFYPGPGFFEDYEAYYVRRDRPERTAADQVLDEIREPMQVVAYFHELLGHKDTTFQEKEVEYARVLLRDHSLQEVRDLTAYAVEQARSTGFDARWFNAVSKYRGGWQQDQARRRAYEERQVEIAACPHCNEKGMVPMKARTGSTTMVACPHDGDLLTAYEKREELRRLPS